jgi:hypothetical protein
MAGMRDGERPGERLWNHPLGRMVMLATGAGVGLAVYAAASGHADYQTGVIMTVLLYLMSLRFAPFPR